MPSVFDPYVQPMSIDVNLEYAAYYAPRGRYRLYLLGQQLSHRYLLNSDMLIGVIGSEGAGKSTLIRALFPGLELTNDDTGVNVVPTPLFKFTGEDFFAGHTFHIDYRYEAAFRPKYEIVDAIKLALEHKRRVIVEHFDLVYEALGFNAHILFGIGEEVIICRPSVFGPSPLALHKVVTRTIRYRRMVHSAEDITCLVLLRDYNYKSPTLHSDVNHGFVIRFPEEPNIRVDELESRIQAMIDQDLPIQPSGEHQISIGDDQIRCTAVRTHVQSTGQIERFRLHKEFVHDPLAKEYLLVGVVGDDAPSGLDEIVAPAYSFVSKF